MRAGDNGSTDLANGTRVEKGSVRIHAIGSVDELNGHLDALLAEALHRMCGGTCRNLVARR